MTRTTDTTSLNTMRARFAKDPRCPYPLHTNAQDSASSPISNLHLQAAYVEDEVADALKFERMPTHEARQRAAHMLDSMKTARYLLNQAERQVVQVARAHGASWADIGASYGISRQAAQQRFTERD
jgi:hypothetical protein